MTDFPPLSQALPLSGYLTCKLNKPCSTVGRMASKEGKIDCLLFINSTNVEYLLFRKFKQAVSVSISHLNRRLFFLAASLVDMYSWIVKALEKMWHFQLYFYVSQDFGITMNQDWISSNFFIETEVVAILQLPNFLLSTHQLNLLNIHNFELININICY